MTRVPPYLSAKRRERRLVAAWFCWLAILAMLGIVFAYHMGMTLRGFRI